MAMVAPENHRLLVIAALATIGFSAQAQAQTYPRDPYAPSGGYRQPTQSSRSAGSRNFPGRGGPAARSSQASSFQDYLNGDLGADDDEEFGRDRGRGMPKDLYDLPGRKTTSRSLDLYGRSSDERDDDQPYRSNAASAKDRQARQAKYVDYLKERDPSKRAQLYREYRENVTGAGAASSSLNRASAFSGSSSSARSRSLIPGPRSGSSILDRGSSRPSSLFSSSATRSSGNTPSVRLNRDDRGTRPAPRVPSGLFPGSASRVP